MGNEILNILTFHFGFFPRFPGKLILFKELDLFSVKCCSPGKTFYSPVIFNFSHFPFLLRGRRVPEFSSFPPSFTSGALLP